MATEKQANNVNRFLLILGLGGGAAMEQYGWVRACCVHGGNERASIEHSQWHKASDDVRSSNSFDLRLKARSPSSASSVLDTNGPKPKGCASALTAASCRNTSPRGLIS
jgi:hypothetical protein